MKSGTYRICRIFILTAPRVAKVEEGKIGLRRNEQRRLASGPGARAKIVRVGLPVLFHVSVLNIKRAIVRASDVDSYDGKRTERSCWMSSAGIEYWRASSISFVTWRKPAKTSVAEILARF